MNSRTDGGSIARSMWRLGTNWAENPYFHFQNDLKGAKWLSLHFALRHRYGLERESMSPSSLVNCGRYVTMYAAFE